jgi:hypothetical protein
MTQTYGALSYRDMAQRLVNAEIDFLDLLTQRGLTPEQAQTAFATFKKVKALKYDAGIGRYTVKHGAFLNDDVIRRAAGLEA